ncbi:MAG: DUF6056 family protein [Butyrivibrio sp.]|nr:DUF6056 family protein [Butyrivibrio sp.]
MMIKAEKLCKTAGIISLAGIAGMILITAVSASYSVPVSDDFWFAADTGRADNAFLYVLASLRRMAHEYMTWQGSYFSEFLNPILNPVNVGGPLMFRIVMVLHALFVYAAILFFVHVLCLKMLGEKNWLECVIMGCVVFAVAEYDTFPEIFFWYTGATVNSIPLAMGLLSISLMMLSGGDKVSGPDINSKKKGGSLIVSACVTGFLSAGGSLAVSGTLCYAALVVIIYRFLDSRRISFEKLAMFACLFAGSLINAAAPGNFARQKVEQSGGGLPFTDSIGNTFSVFAAEMQYLFISTNYAAILLLLVVCGIALSKKLKLNRKAWYISGVFALLTPLVTIFPVVLGYGVAWLPNRCQFIFLVTVVLSYGNFALMLGDFLGNKLAEKSVYPAGALLIISLIIVLAVPFSPWSYRSVRLAKGLVSGTYRENWIDTNEFLDSLKGREGEAVTADIATYPESVEYFYSFFLSDIADDRVNSAVSWAYGLESIRSTRKAGE